MGGYATRFVLNQQDVAQFRALLKQLGMNAERPTEFLNLAGEVIIRETMDAFKFGRDPNTGQPWKDLADATKKARLRPKHRGGRRKRYGTMTRDRASRVRYARSTGRTNRAGESLYGGFKVLQDEGKFRGSVTRQTSTFPPAVAVGSNFVGARVHQFGNPAHKAWGRKPSPLPARPWLLMQFTPKVMATIRQALIAQIRKGKAGQYVREG